jgi:hypothetical protein
MSQIPASVAELRTAFNKHLKASTIDETSPSHHLLRFYAIECGLKCAFLRKEKLKNTSYITDEALLKNGHDLLLWAKKLKIPANICNSDDQLQFNLRSPRGSERWPMSVAHQAWRYGIRIESMDEQRVVEKLNKIKDWINDEV